MMQYTLAAAMVAAMLLLATAAAAAPPPPIGLPGCDTRCGEVSVPYPFGMGPSRCYMPGFNLTCDESNRLLLGDDRAFRVVNISLEDSTVRVTRIRRPINTSRSSSDGDTVTHWGGGLLGGGPYAVSPDNFGEFILTGCNVQATLLANGTQVVSACASLCQLDVALDFSPISDGTSVCSGIACCHADISKDYYQSYDVQLNWLRANGSMGAVDERSDIYGTVYALVAENGWFTRDVKLNLSDQGVAVPLTLDWAMKPASNSSVCSTTESVCRSSNSKCRDYNGDGRFNFWLTGRYMCRCKDGYHGNPYLEDAAGGCQDIDECELKQCYGRCTNTPGSFSCSCPHGTHGNASIPGGCVRSYRGLSIGLGASSAIGLILLVIGVKSANRWFKHRRAERLKRRFFEQNLGHLLQKLVSQRTDIAERMIINLEELAKATNNFDKARKLGGGGHGTVYKGILSDLHVVAIKKPKMVVQQEIDEFINEVALLSQINHRNVVKLYGCCLETEVPMLVYEFIPNGSLYDHLHIEGAISLLWKDRLRIATETAKSLAYLHSAVSPPIIHRDVKFANILLDDTLTAKVSDFGASRCIPLDRTGVTTTVQGTIGYLDPLYFHTWRLTEKSDVYSFGVVLVELLTGKKPFSYLSPEGDGLVAHFITLLTRGSLADLLDQHVKEEGGNEVEEVAVLATSCLKLKGEDRPTMRQVEMALECIRASKKHGSDEIEIDVFVGNGNSRTMIIPSTHEERNVQETSRIFSLEKEFELSASYPR